MTWLNYFPGLLILIVLINNCAYAQPGPDDVPCEARQLDEFSQFSDSIEFRINCFTKIDFDNEMCSWSLAEGNYNTVPLPSSKLMVIIYVEGRIEPESINCIELFDNPQYREQHLDQIQSIFIYEPKSGFNQAYQSRKSIETALNYDIRQGFSIN